MFKLLEKLLNVFFAVTILLSCAPTSRWATHLDWQRYTLDTLPTQEEYPDAGAVILLDDANLEIFSSSGMAFSQLDRRMMVKVLNKRGYKYANITVPYSASSKITNIRARTILPNGKIVTLPEKEVYDITLYPHFVFYSDVRAKRFTMPAVEDGCVIEYSWQKTVRNFTYWTSWQFQNDEPTLIARYSVRCPSDWEINWKTFGLKREIVPEIDKVPKGFKSTRRWEVRDLPAFVPEVGMPPGSRDIAHIMFSPVGMSEWNDIAKWFQNLAGERWAPHKPIRDFTEKLLKGVNDPYEKLKRIFEFVRDNIRYIAIEIGIGGYQPHFASSVLRNRYGDCKDMITLIIAFASAAGIEVKPVLISTWQNGEVDTSLASQAHFNHVIALATLPDSSEIWMDATEKSCSFSELPWYDRNRFVLVVSKSGKAIFKRTPYFVANANQSFRCWKIRIDSTGAAKGSVTMTFRGASASELRVQIARMHPASIDAWFGRDMLARCPDIKCSNVEIEHLSEFEKPLKISAKFTSNGIVGAVEENYSIQLGNLSNFNWYKLFAERERHFDLSLRFPLCSVDEVELTYPEQWTTISSVDSDSIVSEFGKSSWTIDKRTKGKLHYHNSFQLDSIYVSKSKFNNFQNFLNKVALSDQAMVLFRESDTEVP